MALDNAGVGGSTGTTPAPSIRWHATPSHSWPPWVQPDRPARLLHRQLRRAADHAGTPGHGPQAGPGLLGAAGRGWHARVGARGHRRDRPRIPAGSLRGRVLYPPASSWQAGIEAQRRMYARTEDRDAATTWATGEAQYDAVCTWGLPDHARLQRVNAIDVPVFVANGGTDPMILPRYSCLLAGLIPHARVKIYPDSARVLVLASRRVRHRRPGIPHRRQQRHPQAYHNAYPRQRQPATGGGPACLVMAACEARFRSGASAPAACVVSVAPPAAGRRHCRVALSVTGVS